MIKIIFYPPIGERSQNVEYNVADINKTNVADLMLLLNKDQKLAICFENIAKYSSGNILKNLIVVVNDRVVDETYQVHDGDVMKLLLSLAGG